MCQALFWAPSIEPDNMPLASQGLCSSGDDSPSTGCKGITSVCEDEVETDCVCVNGGRDLFGVASKRMR